MGKPRIIMMDEDSAYILSLQAKFSYEYRDVVELEIITDSTYRDALFANYQKADIMLIDEKLYTEELLKHDIAHIFVLTESPEKDHTITQQVEYLYKYTNVRGIFMEIIGNSNLQIMKRKEGEEPKIVLVTSCAGGTGKTTVSLGLAYAMADMGQKVLYIEASHLQGAAYNMEDRSPIKEQYIYEQLGHADTHIYQHIKPVIRQEKFKYLPPMKASLLAFGISYDIYEKIALSAKKSMEFNFIIVDAESVFDSDKTKLMDVADKVIVVTEQNDRCCYATERWFSNINRRSADKYLCVCNKFQPDISSQPNESICDYQVDEYISWIEPEDRQLKKFGKDSNIRKVAFLLL